MFPWRSAKDLPSVPEVFFTFPGFMPGQSRQSVLIEVLRQSVKKLQRAEPRPFFLGGDGSVEARHRAGDLCPESDDQRGSLQDTRLG
jgi:hypothetical protein